MSRYQLKSLFFLLPLLLLLFSAAWLSAHGDDDQDGEQDKQGQVELPEGHPRSPGEEHGGQPTVTANHHGDEHKGVMIRESNVVHAGLSDLPNLHPIVVHFPIMLLLLALLSQLAAFFIWRSQLDIITFILLVGGALGAYAAGNWFHPHTQNLTVAAEAVLAQHDIYADYTVWTSIAGVILKAISLWLYKGKLWLEVVITLVLAGSAVSVGLAGHYGGTLAYVHGVGVQGNFVGEEGGEDSGHSH
jgi:uncharacterized membrane protein